jgi:hypothetical protein
MSILFLLRIGIGIDDTLEASIGIEYRRYFSKVSLTALPTGFKALVTSCRIRSKLTVIRRLEFHRVHSSFCKRLPFFIACDANTFTVCIS